VAYTDPKTWSPGDVLTAADLNTYVRDNTTDKPRARMSRAGSQSIPNNANTIVDFDTSDIDVGGLVDLTNNKFVIQQDGDYLFGAHVHFDAHADGQSRALFLVKNGSIVARVAAQPDAASSPQGIGLHVADMFRLVAGDAMWVVVFQNLGSAIGIGSGEQYSAAYITWQGAA